MKTLLAALFVVGAVVVGVAPSAGGASNGFRPSGIVYHSVTPAVRAHTATAQTTAAAFGCGAITCDAFKTGVNGYLQDVATDSGGSNNVYSVATQYSDNTGNVAYDETFGPTQTYTDTSPFPGNACPAVSSSACLSESQLVSEIQKDMTTN